jgi:hypothetical protein
MRLAVGIAATVAVIMATGLSVAGQTPADVAGDWMLTVDTDQGITNPSVMLEQNGSELTGHYSSETLGEADVKGTVNGNDVMFSLSASAGGFDIEVIYTGTMQDDGTLSGQIDLGGLGGGTFTGQKK